MKISVLRNYARLIARTGVNIQKGQDVIIRCDLDQPKFVELLVDECYKAGAEKVKVEFHYQPLEKLHVRHQTVTALARVDEWEKARLQHYVDKSDTRMGDDGLDMPIFVEATRQFDRIYSQRGLFLLWGRDEMCLEKILKNEGIDEKDVFDTIVISSEHKKKILEELAGKHITEDSLFMNTQMIKDLVSTIKYGDAGTR